MPYQNSQTYIFCTQYSNDLGTDYSQNLYCIGELAQEIIRNRAKLRNWQLNSYTRKVKVPSDIFQPMENSEAVNAV